MKKYNVDWNYWVVRFLFVMALIVGYLLITNYQHFVHSVSGLLGILSPFITGFVIAYLLVEVRKIEGLLERVPLPVVKKRNTAECTPFVPDYFVYFCLDIKLYRSATHW